MDNDKLVTFVVLAYNHSGYILEHLESIAHLVRKHGQVGKHDLVISDDASKDDTADLASDWLERNRPLFRHTEAFYGAVNVGTCQSYLRSTRDIRTDYVKVTGGDDIYSDEDIFSVIRNCDQADIIGSQPIVLIDGVLHPYHSIGLIYALASAVYQDSPFRDHLVGHSSIYTPGLIYSRKMVTDKNIRNFVAQFSLVEDLPSWIAISEYFPEVKYSISKHHLVYYRRTPGSAYLIAGSRVHTDNLNCRNYLLKSEKKPFNKILIRNRIWLMKKCPPRLRKYLDVGRMLFGLKLLTRLPSAVSYIKLLSIDSAHHTSHYRHIQDRAKQVYGEIANSRKIVEPKFANHGRVALARTLTD